MAAVASHQPRGRKEYPRSMRYAVIIVLLLIIGSLASALFYLIKGRGDPRKMALALTFRVGLSVGLFVMLMAGYYFGLIPGRL